MVEGELDEEELREARKMQSLGNYRKNKAAAREEIRQ